MAHILTAADLGLPNPLEASDPVLQARFNAMRVAEMNAPKSVNVNEMVATDPIMMILRLKLQQMP